MKPSWDNAPQWANYLAMDDDGVWYWYENRPRRSPHAVWVSEGKTQRQAAGGDWYKSLEEKP